MKYKYKGKTTIIIYENSVGIVINPGDTVELKEKPNKNFEELKIKKTKKVLEVIKNGNNK